MGRYEAIAIFTGVFFCVLIVLLF